jgi:hypothetical protein
MVLLIPAYARSSLGYPAAGCELITITIEHGIVPPISIPRSGGSTYKLFTPLRPFIGRR